MTGFTEGQSVYRLGDKGKGEYIGRFVRYSSYFNQRPLVEVQVWFNPNQKFEMRYISAKEVC